MTWLFPDCRGLVQSAALSHLLEMHR